MNDREIVRKPLRTRTQIGLAENFVIDMEQGSATIEVALPSNGIRASTSVPVSSATYLAVSLDDAGAIHFVHSDQAFGYV